MERSRNTGFAIPDSVAPCLDATARTAAETRLRESENRYRILVENMAVGITLVDANHKVLAINGVHANLVGRPVDKCIGQECFRVFEKRDAVCPHCPGTRAMETGKAQEVQTTGIRDDGSTYPVRLQAYPVLASDTGVQGFIEVVEDISERKQAEKQLAHFSAIVNSSHDAIIGESLDGIVTSWNPGAEQLYGYTAEEMVGQPISTLVPSGRIEEGVTLLSGSGNGESIPSVVARTALSSMSP